MCLANNREEITELINCVDVDEINGQIRVSVVCVLSMSTFGVFVYSCFCVVENCRNPFFDTKEKSTISTGWNE